MHESVFYWGVMQASSLDYSTLSRDTWRSHMASVLLTASSARQEAFFRCARSFSGGRKQSPPHWDLQTQWAIDVQSAVTVHIEYSITVMAAFFWLLSHRCLLLSIYLTKHSNITSLRPHLNSPSCSWMHSVGW